MEGTDKKARHGIVGGVAHAAGNDVCGMEAVARRVCGKASADGVGEAGADASDALSVGGGVVIVARDGGWNEA